MEREETQILMEVECDVTNLCEESVESTGARNAVEQDINTLDKQIALPNKRYSENVDKQQNDVSHSAEKDGESTERTKRRRRQRKRTNKPSCVDSNTDKAPDRTGNVETCILKEVKRDVIVGGHPCIETVHRAGAQNVIDQENLVKTNPRKNLESLPERKHNAENAINLYRGRGVTNSDTCGRGYMRGLNRSQGQSFNSNKNRGSTYDGDRGRRGSDFNRGRGISDNRGRGRADFNGGRGRSDDRGRGMSEFNSDRGRPSFNRGHGRSEFGRDSERKYFNSGSRMPYFNRGKVRRSSYVANGGNASYAQSNTELKGDSYDAKANNFAYRDRENGEFNRGRTSSYTRNVTAEIQRKYEEVITSLQRK
ncbi:hypothetical protein QYM36_016525 [Artemia franciscana]|uniref:Uncharacterized protein n=1 Tax=Artemia franciscana TaxID=6661 RepID=A0AA88HGB9_ARTSF|nr:hypothetical protein QYM36_016525 [Artemia franciscana]